MKELLFSIICIVMLTNCASDTKTINTTKTTKPEIKEASEEARAKVAKAKLNKESSVSIMYVKGLCCPSCAIGIRKKVNKLEFVDTTRFVGGVVLDTKYQLVVVALKDGKQVKSKPFAQAIVDAGYDPMHLYHIKDGTLVKSPLGSTQK